MPKHLLEDMVMTKWPKKENAKIKNLPKDKVVNSVDYNKNRPRYMLWFVAFISAVFCFVAFSFLFSKAEITVNPKIQEVILNKNLSALKDPNTDSLSFNLVVIEGVEDTTVKVNGEKDVANKATGLVVIYNAFSSSSQTLNIDTRLEGSNGKVYKTQAKTVVLGMEKDGKPGSVEVGIYGEKAGVEYNSAPLDFKIFGFKGTPKYSKFYGRSKGAITGGFKGKAPDVPNAEKASIFLNLRNSLQAKLLQKSINLIPEGFILFKDAIFLKADDSAILSTYNKEDNTTMFTLKGTLYGILFNEQKLTKKIALDNIENYDGSDVYISNIRDLAFSLQNKDNVLFDSVRNISFNLSGPAKIVSRLDVDKFINDLLGKTKKDFTQLLSQYGNIESATLTVNPPWKMSIPDKSKNLKVIINYPK